MSFPPFKKPSSQRGVALIIVLFVMALASILVVNLASSTSLSAHRIAYAQRSIEAEFVLKSAMNLARGLIASQGSNSNSDSLQSPWGMFASGAAVPMGLIPDFHLGENVNLSLEIRPENTKIPVKQIFGGARVDTFWQNSLIRLMVNLGFDKDGEVDQTGRFPNRVITPAQLVGLIIDYLDPDSTSSDPSFGEADLPKELFSNNNDIQRLEDLAALPGFTTKRLQLLSPYISVEGTAPITQININLAPSEVLTALDTATQTDVDAIMQYRDSSSGPFNSVTLPSILPTIAPSFGTSPLLPKVTSESQTFDIIVKAEYGNATYYLKAIVSKGGTVPNIDLVELY